MRFSTLLTVTLVLSTAAALPAQAAQEKNTIFDELRHENLEKDAVAEVQTKNDRFDRLRDLRRENLEKSVSLENLCPEQL